MMRGGSFVMAELVPAISIRNALPFLSEMPSTRFTLGLAGGQTRVPGMTKKIQHPKNKLIPALQTALIFIALGSLRGAI